MINQYLLSEIELIKVNDTFYTANYRNKIFSIGDVLYDVLNYLKKGNSIGDIELIINDKYEINVNEIFLENEIEKFVSKLTVTEKRTSTIDYIYFRIKIFGEKTIDLLSAPFLFLFNKYLFPILITISVILSFLLSKVIYDDGLWMVEVSLKKSVIGIISIYTGFAILGLFHELGHATSSRFYKRPSKEIGFGLYLIFPVFYTDVTQIWTLDRFKRVVVNLAGIYFQLLINVVFFLSYVLIDSIDVKILIKFFYISNMILLIYSINPFFRNDGYWVYSDLFNIPNLMAESVDFPKRLYSKFKSKVPFMEKIQFVFSNKALGIYSILLHIVFILFIALFLWLTYQNGSELLKIISNVNQANWRSHEQYFKLFKLIVGLFINIYFLIVIIKRLSNNGKRLPI